MFKIFIFLFFIFCASSANVMFPDRLDDYVFSERRNFDQSGRPIERDVDLSDNEFLRAIEEVTDSPEDDYIFGDDEDEDPCAGQDYCEFPKNYPEREILAKLEDELRNTKLLRLLLTKPKTLELRGGFSDYDYLSEEPKNVCSMTSQDIRPRKHKNTQDKDMFIVNSPMGRSEYTQEISVGMCRGRDVRVGRSLDELKAAAGTQDECGQGLGSTFEGKTECFQEFLAHKLLALDPSNNEIVMEEFYFPSCCVCKVINLEN